ncbi:MAG: flagellar export protein FliJ [Treponema sp.]|nr:flagellar export protein FliJ [Treponema sp.]MBP5451994.1 flagellar export protein FliJ [Treponema sp.]
MKRFSYSLQKILDLRNFELDQAQMELGKVNAQIANVNNQLKSVASQKFQATKQADELNDFSLHVQTQDFFIYLDQRKDALLAELVQLEMIAEQKRELVREAMKKVKVLEKLKEKKYEAWKVEFQRQEELEQDDVVTAQTFQKVMNEESLPSS